MTFDRNQLEIKPKRVIWEKEPDGLIKPCPGFVKKKLAIFKIDLMALCQFGCRYCSSNCGNNMRLNTPKIYTWTKEQLGKHLSPRTDANKFYMVYEDPIGILERQLLETPSLKRIKETLQFGMLVDNFSPDLVKSGVTIRALEILLKETLFTIRILTKSAAVAGDGFVNIFQRYPGRVIIGLSCGSLDNGLMKHIELGTSLPTARAKAIRDLQDARVRTFGMFCPILPGATRRDDVEALYAAFNPHLLETVWCEPYNDRQNWRYLHDNIPNSPIREGVHDVMTDKTAWTEYALNLARRHHKTLEKFNFTGESIYLLYEASIGSDAIARARKISGVLFQSDPTLNSDCKPLFGKENQNAK